MARTTVIAECEMLHGKCVHKPLDCLLDARARTSLSASGKTRNVQLYAPREGCTARYGALLLAKQTTLYALASVCIVNCDLTYIQ